VAAAALCVVAGALSAGCLTSDGAVPAPASAAAGADAALPVTENTAGQGAPVPSAGCAAAQPGPVTDLLQGLDVAGVPRWYLLTTPSPDSPGASDAATATSPVPRPLVLDFAGLGQSASAQATMSQFGTLGQQDGFVVAFPEGTADPVRWDMTSLDASNPDLEFVSALLDQLEATQCIDVSRVYASGFSDGAYMASALACAMSDRITAVGAVSGLQSPTRCPAVRPVPVIAFHGTADPILPFDGGTGTANLSQLLDDTEATPTPVPTAAQDWAARDGCDTRSAATDMASQVVMRHYRCPAGTDVQLYVIDGGGHTWPGSLASAAEVATDGPTTFQIDATSLMWSFFQRFQL
jgi:polyhydroxybutyrate depolymerase